MAIARRAVAPLTAPHTSSSAISSVLGWIYFRYSFVFHTYSAFVLELVLGVFVWAERRRVLPTILADSNEPSNSVVSTRASLVRQRLGLGLILAGSVLWFVPQVPGFIVLGLIVVGFAFFIGA